MTDRARLVYALLRTLLAWTPSPRSRMGLDRVPRGFEGGTVRYVSCPDCLANDQLHGGMPGCETCGGRGEIPDPGPDPYETKNSTRFGGVAAERTAEAERRRDLEIDRMTQQLAHYERIEDEPVVDPLTDAIDLRDRLYRQGSYAELEKELGRLRLEQPQAYELAMAVAYAPFGEEPIDPVRKVVVQICELLAVRIDGPIRVPPFVPVSENAELERLAREGKGALWRGRGDWHLLKRGERNALMVAMHADGHSWTEIALRFNVTRRRAQQIVREHGAEGVATGPAA